METSIGMPDRFISERIEPMSEDIDTTGMSRGEPGFPRQFRWRGELVDVAELLESSKERTERYGEGEKYTRKHCYRIRTTDGVVMNIYFERQMRTSAKARWWIYTIED